MSETIRQHDVRVHGVDVYAVPCSVCDAKVGELCSVVAGGARNGEPHALRVIAAKAELEAKAAQP